MKKRIQTRRAVSVSFTAYDEITRRAAHQMTSRSSVLEKVINDHLDKIGAPVPDDPEEPATAREITAWK